MLRLLMGVIVSAGLAHLGAWYLPCSVDADIRWTAIQDRQERLELAFENQKRFRAELCRTLLEIAEEDLPLAQGIEQIESASRKYHPVYLQSLFLMRKGKALKVQVAYNILHHFESGLQRNKQRKRLCSTHACSGR